MVRTIRSLLLVFAWLSVAAPASPMAAQSVPALSGVVVDQADARLPGARVTVRDAGGRVVHTSVTKADGAFGVPQLTPGEHLVAVELPLFQTASMRVTVPRTGPVPALRIVLTVGGFSDGVVVTGRRVETRIVETPQKVEIVDATDLARTVATALADALKKNAGVDVIQYAGVLAGIGIRGFRPQFSGVNKRSLLLIDGRPSGVTNLGTLRLDSIDRIEILKGAASSVYRLVGDGRGRQCDHPTITREDWWHGARRRRQLRDDGVLGTCGRQRVVTC